MFFGGARRTLLFFCLPVSNPTVLTDNPFGFMLSLSSIPEAAEAAGAGTNDSARDKGGETRFGAVPIALEIESNGRIGRETGKEGIRRGKVAEVGEGEVGDVGDVGEVQVAMPNPPLLRYTELEDCTRLVGMLEKTGSGRKVASLTAALYTFCPCRVESLESDSASDEELHVDPGRVIADVGVFGESAVDDDEEEDSSYDADDSESEMNIVALSKCERRLGDAAEAITRTAISMSANAPKQRYK